jgi:hypothetical protein
MCSVGVWWGRGAGAFGIRPERPKAWSSRFLACAVDEARGPLLKLRFKLFQPRCAILKLSLNIGITFS